MHRPPHPRERKFAAPGDRIVIVTGAALGTPGTLDGIVLHTLGEQWTGNVESEFATSDVAGA